MSRALVLRRIAAEEFDDSIAWYDRQGAGLGREFRATIEDHLRQITDNPERFPRVRRNVRRAVVRRFPFVIHFLVEADQIVVLSVFHTSRDPGRLKSRR
jgi:plasmid stabilization system protein ParE